MPIKFFAAKCPKCSQPVVRKENEKAPLCVDCKIKHDLPI